MSRIEFSVVMPVKNAVHLIRYSLPSVIRLDPTEIVLAFDKPPDSSTFDLAHHIVEGLGAEEKTKFLEVPRNAEFKMHQAWVRRRGFSEACCDRILTVDADLFVYPTVLEAIDMLGRNNIGLVSCRKIFSLLDFHTFWRSGFDVVRKFIGKTKSSFTGLYAFWRPFWLETEDNSVKKISRGEDVHLCLSMSKKHRCIFLKDIGAYCLGKYKENNVHNQFRTGQWFAQHASLRRALIDSLFTGRFFELWGFLHERLYPDTEMMESPGFYFDKGV